MNIESRHIWLTTAVGLLLILAIGTYLRLFDLPTKSITHPEMYVPGIRMPVGLSEPRERLTVWSVLTGTFSSDTHPPGYYLIMLAWTKYFGAELWSIRLPSALFGIASIPLLFWLGTLTGARNSAWIAATLLAVSGYHVFWSKVARMHSLECFLGLLATTLLLILARSATEARWLRLLYALVILIGLASYILFWSLFAAHILWVAWTAWIRKQPMPGVMKWQLLIAILASPLLVFAVYQSGNTLAIMSSDVLGYARDLVQFTFLFATRDLAAGVPPLVLSFPFNLYTDFPLFRIGFLIFSLVLLILGVASVKQRDETLLADTSGPSSSVWLGVGGVGVLAALVFIAVNKAYLERPLDTLSAAKVASPLPLLLGILAILLSKLWPRFRALSFPGFGAKISGAEGLILMAAFVPFMILAVISQFKPILNQRGLLFMAPYLLLLLARGMSRLVDHKLAAVFLFLVMTCVSVESVISYSGRRLDPVDFRAFAAQVTPQIEKSDLVFVKRAWYGTPILYYVTADRYKLVGQRYEEALRQNHYPRVWVLLFYDDRVHVPPSITKALANYQVIRTLDGPEARAVLYVPYDERSAGN